MEQWRYKIVKKSKDLINIALENIIKDREKTDELLQELSSYLVGSYDKFAESGNIAAKYLETLQRSNEQLVKLTSLVQKKEANVEDTNLSEDDKEELFELIKVQDVG
tara:strand:- start:246 stop:566 length:321 start_codon:yes stop_codon:yes gene_type:complete